jgi:uncharacterized protein
MKVFLTGATGLVGRALVLRLQRDGHTLRAWVRSTERARSQLGPDVQLVEASTGMGRLAEEVRASEAVIHLAGAPIGARRWTAARQREILEGRRELTTQIAQSVPAGAQRVLISASAVGYYGARGDEPLGEDSSPGQGFLARVCRAWEAATLPAARAGARVVLLRTGLVLARDGGLLGSLLPLYRLGLGGRVGDGRQVMPWIHLDDLVELIATALVDARYQGPVNATAPQPVTQREFSAALGHALGRPARLPVPAFALRALLGERATLLLQGQRALPQKALGLAFQFSFPRLELALDDLLDDSNVVIGGSREAPPSDASSLGVLPPQVLQVLRSKVTLDAPLAQVFEFFSKPENLGLMTPRGLQFQIQTKSCTMHAGARIDYRIVLGILPLRWRTHIANWSPPHVFADRQERGPYRFWWHEHRFLAEGLRTSMEDRVYYTLPFGWLGRIVHALLVKRQLRAIFGYRGQAVRLRFGTEGRALTANSERPASQHVSF